MRPNSNTVIRMWTRDGNHRDILVIDSKQVMIHDPTCVTEPLSGMVSRGGLVGPSMVVVPSKYPEAVCFQVIVVPYSK